jgi:hypothetical protein
VSTIFERLTEVQNAHDAERFASYFADDYQSDQPAHPDRAFSGRAQVLENWTSVFAGVPDFRAELVSSCRDGNVEWGEFDWGAVTPMVRPSPCAGSSSPPFTMAGSQQPGCTWSPSSTAARTLMPPSSSCIDRPTRTSDPSLPPNFRR